MENEKIKMIRESQVKQGTQWKTESEPITEYIDLNQFKKSYVKERWYGEKRYNRKYTKLGYFHTKTIVKFDDTTRIVRSFIFPK